jgi:hypothetical protein
MHDRPANFCPFAARRKHNVAGDSETKNATPEGRTQVVSGLADIRTEIPPEAQEV